MLPDLSALRHRARAPIGQPLDDQTRAELTRILDATKDVDILSAMIAYLDTLLKGNAGGFEAKIPQFIELLKFVDSRRDVEELKLDLQARLAGEKAREQVLQKFAREEKKRKDKREAADAAEYLRKQKVKAAKEAKSAIAADR